jgi:hypothetical protein
MDKITPNQEQKQKMFKLIEACHKSGLSNKEWCRQNNIAEHIFYYWQANYKKENSQAESFLPISTKQKTSTGIKIVYPNGVHIELSENTSPSIIATLINLA